MPPLDGPSLKRIRDRARLGRATMRDFYRLAAEWKRMKAEHYESGGGISDKNYSVRMRFISDRMGEIGPSSMSVAERKKWYKDNIELRKFRSGARPYLS
jgi:3-hydroxyacyl-CoA dehydrogenase